MLKALRNKSTQKKIYIALSVLILPGFLIWGVTFSLNEKASSSSALGRIENKVVSLQDYLKSYKAVQHQVELFYGEKAGLLSRHMNLKGQAWDRILLLYYAKKEKIKTGDSEVVDWISKQFSLKGQFDETLYKRYVEAALRSNPREFEEEVRGSITISKVSEQLKSKITVTDDELKKTYDEEHKEKEADGVKFDDQKEELRKKLFNQKLDAATQKLLTNLRNKLTLNLEMMKKLFPSEENLKPASTEGPLAPS